MERGSADVYVDRDLRFLSGKVVIYYAGLDWECLPFGEGEAVVRDTASQQLLLLKCLSLVADHIVIPPASMPYWVSCHDDTNTVDFLIELFNAYILISPIYTGMNSGRDFIENKLASGDVMDVRHISASLPLLSRFFSELPVLHRNVKKQSTRFQQTLMTMVTNSSNLPSREELIDHISAGTTSDVVLSRSSLSNKLREMEMEGVISRNAGRRYYYLMNKAYYTEGAATYEANISMYNACRYSVLGKDVFNDTNGILLAYDPKILLAIFACFGISNSDIEILRIEDIQKIRSLISFPIFIHEFYEFAKQVQAIDINMSFLSKQSLERIQKHILTTYAGELHAHRDRFDKATRNASLTTSLLLTLATGGIGTLFTPAISFGVGTVPWLLDLLGVNNVAHKAIADWMEKNKIVFHVYTSELRKVINTRKKKRRIL